MNLVFEHELIRKGFAEGVLTGKAEGKVEGKAESLTQLLVGKFGELGLQETSKIKAASSEQIDAWFARAINAPSLVAVLGGN